MELKILPLKNGRIDKNNNTDDDLLKLKKAKHIIV